jgi:hypothetical protein
MNTNNDNKSINATPDHGIIPFPESSTSSPKFVNVDSITFGNNSSPVDTSLIPIQVNEPIQSVPRELIERIKANCIPIKECDEKVKHWKQRAFESALKVGEDLVTLRKKCDEDQVGFKKLVETEFSTEFCYKTAIRYMKLYNKRSKLPSDVCTIRKAFVSLGILKEEYQYPKEETDNTPNPVEPNSTPQPKPKKSRIRKSQSVSRTNLFEHPGSLMFTSSINGHRDRLFQIIVDSNGKLQGMDVEDPSQQKLDHSDFQETVFNHLKPFVEWYNRAKIYYPTPTVTPVSTDDGPDLKIAA